MNYVESLKKYWNIIIDCPLFAGISPEYINDMLVSLDSHIGHYPKNEIIINLGDEFRCCGIVLEGTLEVSYNTNRFEKHNVNHFSTCKIFGESLALKGIAHSPVQVAALTDAVVLLIDLRKLVLSTNRCNRDCIYNHQLLLNIMDRMAEQIIFSNLKLRILGQKSLRDRIMIYLTHMNADKPEGAELPFSQTSLAEFLGVNRSALARELGRMQDDRILKINKKHYWILTS